MEDDRGTRLERALEKWRCEGVIDDQQCVPPLRNPGDRAEVGQTHQGVRRRLDDDGSGTIGACVVNALWITGINEGESETEVLQNPVEEAKHSSVGVVAADDMIAAPEEFHDAVEAGHAAREREAVRAAFEDRHISLERFARGVGAARVFPALVLSHRLLRVRGGQVDGRHDRP